MIVDRFSNYPSSGHLQKRCTDKSTPSANNLWQWGQRCSGYVCVARLQLLQKLYLLDRTTCPPHLRQIRPAVGALSIGSFFFFTTKTRVSRNMKIPKADDHTFTNGKVCHQEVNLGNQDTHASSCCCPGRWVDCGDAAGGSEG